MIDETTIRTVLGVVLSVVGFFLMTGVAITAYFLKSLHAEFKSMVETIQRIREEFAQFRAEDKSRHEAIDMLRSEFDEMRRDLVSLGKSVTSIEASR